MEFSFINLLALTILIPASIAVYTQNPIYSVLGLILVFFGVSILLFLIESDFLAMVFLVVYIGAVAVLFLFVVMMLDLRIESDHDAFLVSLGYITIFIAVFGILEYLFDIRGSLYFSWTVTGLGVSGSEFDWPKRLFSNSNIVLIGQLLYTYYIIPFLISGFILFLAMVGSIVLTLYHSYGTKRQDLFSQLDRNNNIHTVAR